MINRPTSLVNLAYLLTYSDTEHASPGSRRRFRVNVGFTDDQSVMEHLYVLKIMEQKTY